MTGAMVADWLGVHVYLPVRQLAQANLQAAAGRSRRMQVVGARPAAQV